MMRIFAVITTICILTATAPTVRAEDPLNLVTGSCTSCHAAAKICEKLGKKDLRYWGRTADRMNRYMKIKKDLEPLSPDQIAMIAAYLNGRQQGQDELCQ